MNRNFVTFLAMSTAMLLVFVGLQRLFLPNAPQQVVKQAAEKEKKDRAAGDTDIPVAVPDTGKVANDPPADKPAEPAAGEIKLDQPAEQKPETKAEVDTLASDKPAEPAADKPVDKPADVAVKPEDKPAVKPADNPAQVAAGPVEQVITLGSMDPAKGYRLLVTLTSRGAAVERIELVDEKKVDRFRYRAIEHRGGYLGYLGWRPANNGVMVTTVPADSPAALAKCGDVAGGLIPGDIVNSIDGVRVRTYDAIQHVLKEIKAAKFVDIEVTREANGQTRSLKFSAQLSQPPLDVLRTQEYLSEQVPGNLHRASCLTTLATVGNQEIPIGMRTMKGLENTLVGMWQVTPLAVEGGQGVEFRLPLGKSLGEQGITADLELVKRYRLLPVKPDATDPIAANAEAYTLDFETVVENHSAQSVDTSLRHEALAGITLEGWWYSVKISPYFFKGAGQRDVRYCNGKGIHDIVLARTIYDRELKMPSDQGLFINAGGAPELRSLKYVGLDAQYFAAAFIPHPEDPKGLDNLKQAGSEAVANVTKIVTSQSQAVNTAFWFETTKASIEPGQSLSTRYRVFAGPKDTRTLDHFGLHRFIEYGWIPLIAKPLSFILYIYYSIVRNYGISIILLTILVRGCMFPLGRQAALNGQKMQELQPELKRINEEYKEDMQKRAAAMQELYKKHNFRPLSGCLPLFVQLPIFMGLYRCLSVDISLRQEPLIPGLSWCSNLAGPDMLFDWSSWMPEIIAGRGTGYLGPYFNLLPVITIALFLIQQRVLMPKATDEQMQMTQNMMQIMTVVMGVMFFKVPSGLCIYFITSSIWSLAERKLVKYLLPPKSSTPIEISPPPTPNRPTSGGSNKRKKETDGKPQSNLASRWAEFRELLEKPAVKSSTHRNDDKKKKRK